MLCETLSTEPQDIPISMCAPFMRVISCPKWLHHLKTIDLADELVQKIAEDDHVNCCLTVFNGKPWIRISGNIYNSKEDYLRLSDVILKYRK